MYACIIVFCAFAFSLLLVDLRFNSLFLPSLKEIGVSVRSSPAFRNSIRPLQNVLSGPDGWIFGGIVIRDAVRQCL